MGQKMGKQRSADITPAPKDKVKRRKSKREANGDTQGTITPTGDGVVAAATAAQKATQASAIIGSPRLQTTLSPGKNSAQCSALFPPDGLHCSALQRPGLY
ncbi:hypothetical protein HPB52_000167 [Rhipicephalus sanguineus]|uniref:Uncharacterized protein n=1 Tax=Rhipicephalus sanguineus TaxID=34632 RepID=A0A9D4PE81_RHISA|nr:hypothetical protein HPB52_000167 [Rhipicephalus sanguineus]